jgi:hypothetical protein
MWTDLVRARLFFNYLCDENNNWVGDDMTAFYQGLPPSPTVHPSSQASHEPTHQPSLMPTLEPTNFPLRIPLAIANTVRPHLCSHLRFVTYIHLLR